jgi:hypothetical protein
MTLGGLLKHLALVEDAHFAKMLFNREPGPPWDAVDWDAEPDWEWTSAASDSPDELMSMWEQAVDRSRQTVCEGESPNLRRTLLDLIEEYARHVGHADLIRESVDGLTGEDPPE